MHKTGILLLSSLFLASVAYADNIQLSLNGSVSSSNLNTIQAGQAITITINYESSGAPQFTANQQGFYVDHLSSFSVSTNNYAHTVSGSFGQIDIYDNLASTDGISFQAAVNPATYQFTNPKPQIVNLGGIFANNVNMTFDEVHVNLASNSNAIWSGFALPVSYNFASFDQTQNFAFAFSGGGFSGGFTNLTATNLTLSPEPGTWLLIASSLAGVALFRRTKRV